MGRRSSLRLREDIAVEEECVTFIVISKDIINGLREGRIGIRMYSHSYDSDLYFG